LREWAAARWAPACLLVGGSPLCLGNVGRNLADEVFEVAEGLKPVDDGVIANPDVPVDQDVPEADRLADGTGEFRRP
jgi:hypothetical protein